MSELEKFKSDKVFHYFKEISKIPRGSGNSKAISDYLVAFASSRNLSYVKDAFNNVIIYKEGSRKCQNNRPVMLQAHMDMVCEKTKNSMHDFFKDGIDVIVDDTYIRAKDTSLGADDGIGMSYILALLDSKNLMHPPLEAVFTADEEIGLLGAAEIDEQYIHSKYLINLDSEKEGVFYVGCAGAMGGTTEISTSSKERYGVEWKIELSGLLGGHSGIDVDKNRGNAILLLSRFLFELRKEMDYSISFFKGGENNNAIPAKAEVCLVIQLEDEENLQNKISQYLFELKKEYFGCEDTIKISGRQERIGNIMVIDEKSKNQIIDFLTLYPNGVHKKCGYLNDVVETSCMLVIAELHQNSFYAFTSIRSSLEASKNYFWEKIVRLTELIGGKVDYVRGYPAWEYKEESRIKKLMIDTYREVYGSDPAIMILHAGLECSFFTEKIKDLECISIGPDIFDIHTPNEHASIDSINRVWKYLINVLEQLNYFD